MVLKKVVALTECFTYPILIKRDPLIQKKRNKLEWQKASAMLLGISSIESLLNILLKKSFIEACFMFFAKSFSTIPQALIVHYCISLEKAKKTEVYDGFWCTLYCYWIWFFQEFTISLDRTIAICFSKLKLNPRKHFFVVIYFMVCHFPLIVKI